MSAHLKLKTTAVQYRHTGRQALLCLDSLNILSALLTPTILSSIKKLTDRSHHTRQIAVQLFIHRVIVIFRHQSVFINTLA